VDAGEAGDGLAEQPRQVGDLEEAGHDGAAIGRLARGTLGVEMDPFALAVAGDGGVAVDRLLVDDAPGRDAFAPDQPVQRLDAAAGPAFGVRHHALLKTQFSPASITTRVQIAVRESASRSGWSAQCLRLGVRAVKMLLSISSAIAVSARARSTFSSRGRSPGMLAATTRDQRWFIWSCQIAKS